MLSPNTPDTPDTPNTPPNSQDTPNLPTTLHSIITGQNQNEYFLAWIEEQANVLELTGWARHLSDNEVEVIAQGLEDNCRDLLAKLLAGSAITGVNNVTEEWLPDYQAHDIFEIR